MYAAGLEAHVRGRLAGTCELMWEADWMAHIRGWRDGSYTQLADWLIYAASWLAHYTASWLLHVHGRLADSC